MQAAIHSSSVIEAIRGCVPEPDAGVEVGVQRGRTSQQLLDEWPGLFLWAVDPWSEYADNHPLRDWWQRRLSRTSGQDHRLARHAFLTQQGHDEVKQCALKLFSKPRYRHRVTVLDTTSERAADQIPDNRVDFVFIDGDHTQTGQDMELWWPKLTPGGVLVGHDYNARLSRRGVWDVNRAVDAFVTRRELQLTCMKNHVWAIQCPASGGGSAGV